MSDQRRQRAPVQRQLVRTLARVPRAIPTRPAKGKAGGLQLPDEVRNDRHQLFGEKLVCIETEKPFAFRLLVREHRLVLGIADQRTYEHTASQLLRDCHRTVLAW